MQTGVLLMLRHTRAPGRHINLRNYATDIFRHTECSNEHLVLKITTPRGQVKPRVWLGIHTCTYVQGVPISDRRRYAVPDARERAC